MLSLVVLYHISQSSSSSDSDIGVQGWSEELIIWIGVIVLSLCGCVLCSKFINWRKQKRLRKGQLYADDAKLLELGEQVKSVPSAARFDEVDNGTDEQKENNNSEDIPNSDTPAYDPIRLVPDDVIPESLPIEGLYDLVSARGYRSAASSPSRIRLIQ